jgi:hypothetical protein
VLGRSGAVQNGLLAGDQTPHGVGRGELNLVERKKESAGGVLEPVRVCTAHVNEDGATGGNGLVGGAHVDAWGFAIGGGAGGLAETDATSGKDGQRRQNGQAGEAYEPAPVH